MQPIRMGVIDGHPYVRRTAVMGVLKVYNLDSNAVKNAGESSPRFFNFLVLDLCFERHCRCHIFIFRLDKSCPSRCLNCKMLCTFAMPEICEMAC